MWFRRLVGFQEENPDQVRENLKLDGEYLTSIPNGKSMRAGLLSIPTLAKLRNELALASTNPGKIKISQIIADVIGLHTDIENTGATFQAASQFNLLEMVGPHVTPEMGIDGYDQDLTQGPACAIACGAGTIFRNYFVDVEGQIGQSSEKQIDCLRNVGDALLNKNQQYWKMSNGYMIPTPTGLDQLNIKFSFLSEKEKESIFSNLRIGVQSNTAVTISDCKHTVTQVYCSAVPINYSIFDHDDWSEFARLVLNATYEATFISAILNNAKGGSNKLFLTLVGGGVFGNKLSWILNAIQLSVIKYRDYSLDVKIVSYGGKNQIVEDFLYGIRTTIANNE